MRNTDLDLADKLAMTLGGGLILLAIPVIGFITTLSGSMSPLYKYQVTKGGEQVVKHGLASSVPEGATVLQAPLVDPMTRGWIVFVGLLVFAVYGVYRLVSPKVDTDRRTAERATTAD